MIKKIFLLSKVVLLHETTKTPRPLATKTNTYITRAHNKYMFTRQTWEKLTSSVQQPAVLLLVSDQDHLPGMNILRGFLALHVPYLRVSHSISTTKRSSINREKLTPKTKDLKFKILKL